MDRDWLLQRDRRPLYEQAQTAIIELIENGELKVGEKLPREEDLAANLGVSRTTIRTALGNLEAFGYISRIQGAGTFVSKRREVIVNPLDTIRALHPHMASAAGLPSHIEDLEIEQILLDADGAHHMKLPEKTSVIKISRTVVVNHTPFAYLIDHIPENIINFWI